MWLVLCLQRQKRAVLHKWSLPPSLSLSDRPYVVNWPGGSCFCSSYGNSWGSWREINHRKVSGQMEEKPWGRFQSSRVPKVSMYFGVLAKFICLSKSGENRKKEIELWLESAYWHRPHSSEVSILILKLEPLLVAFSTSNKTRPPAFLV